MGILYFYVSILHISVYFYFFNCVHKNMDFYKQSRVTFRLCNFWENFNFILLRLFRAKLVIG